MEKKNRITALFSQLKIDKIKKEKKDESRSCFSELYLMGGKM